MSRGGRSSKGERREEVRLLPRTTGAARLWLIITRQLLCRYAASKDRRALDPPSVVGLRIFDVRDTGNGAAQHTELDYR